MQLTRTLLFLLSSVPLAQVFANPIAAAKKFELDNVDWEKTADGESGYEDNEHSSSSITPRSEYSSLDELVDEGRNDEPGAGETPWEETHPPTVVQPSVCLAAPIPQSTVSGAAPASTESTGSNSSKPTCIVDQYTVVTDADVTWCRPWPNTAIATTQALKIYKFTILNLTCWVHTNRVTDAATGALRPDAQDIWVKTGDHGCYINENDIRAATLNFEDILHPCTAPGPHPLQPNPGKPIPVLPKGVNGIKPSPLPLHLVPALSSTPIVVSALPKPT